MRLDYTFTAGAALSRFLTNIQQKRIVGQRCPQCAKVYVPPRGSCPTCGVATSDEVEVAHRGIVTTFCIVNIPVPGMVVKPPFARNGKIKIEL